MEQNFYDARLQTLTDTEAVYEWHERTLLVPKPAHSDRLDQQIGQVGVLVIDEEGGEPGFFRFCRIKQFLSKNGVDFIEQFLLEIA